MKNTLIIGARGSQLALTQTRMVADAIQKASPELSISIRTFKTTGDRVTDAPLMSFGGQGVFVKELERALLDGEIDLAVHSLKDLPTLIPEGLLIAATPERADVRDALISRHGMLLEALPTGACVATSSPRRRAQLLAYRPDLRLSEIRGNIDTRLRILAESPDAEALILACAGLDRMGWGDRITERLSCDVCMPAAGQAALALETRADDRQIIARVRLINHLPTEQAITAERWFLRQIGGGCHTPVGAWARISSDTLVMDGTLAAPDGTWLTRASVTGPVDDAVALGQRLAETILKQCPEGP